jgi:hypothetical protein
MISSLRILPNRIISSNIHNVIGKTTIKMFNNNNGIDENSSQSSDIKEEEPNNGIKAIFKNLYFGLGNVSTFVIIAYTVIIIIIISSIMSL